MTRRGIAAIALALLAIAMPAAPADAIAYGGWNARATLDSWYDDNLARGTVVSTTALPYGNSDFGLHVGLGLGNVFVLTPDIDTWVIVNAHGRVGAFYPSLSGAWGSVFSNTVWHLDGGRELYGLLGVTHFLTLGTYWAGELGFAQPLWWGGTARLEAGAGSYRSFTSGYSFAMPSVGGGFDQVFTTGTTVGFRYAYQTQFYDASRIDPRHQLYLLASQRLNANWELHAHYLKTFDVSATTGYTEGYVDFGVGYDF
jgi:hypothetical protein